MPAPVGPQGHDFSSSRLLPWPHASRNRGNNNPRGRRGRATRKMLTYDGELMARPAARLDLAHVLDAHPALSPRLDFFGRTFFRIMPGHMAAS